MTSVLIFDFDGVILESVNIKTEAFRRLFSFSPEHVDEIVRFHQENGGMSRFDKFRHIYTSILHEDLSSEKFEELSDTFSCLVENAVKEAPFIAGVEKFICKAWKYAPLYIVSATPEDELKRIVHEKGIAPYFKNIFGSPVKKVDHIRQIIVQDVRKPEEVLFIGDAINDLNAARECGVRFIGRIRPGDKNIFENHSGVEYLIADFYDLDKYLNGEL